MMINLNADLGESFGAWRMGDDDALLPLIDSASIACGFHAGDPGVMRATLRRALAAGVETGAHPSYPDLQGFGRRTMHFETHEVEALVIYQVGALAAFASAEGASLTHVKPHGALNNQACVDRGLAAAIASAIRAVDPGLILLAPAASVLAMAGRDQGLAVALEVFAELLEANLQGRGTGSACLALDADLDEIVLSRSIYRADIDVDYLEQELDAFLTLLEYWQQRSEAGEIGRLRGAVSADATPIPPLGRGIIRG